MEPQARKPYGIAAYLRARALALACGIASLLIAALMLAMLQVGFQAIVIVAVFASAPLVIALVIGYTRSHRFYQSLASATQDPVTVKHLTNEIERPRFLEGGLAWDALAAQDAVFSEEIGEQRQEARAYQDYIELWIHEVKTPIAAARLILDSEHGERAERLSSEIDRIERQVESALYYARSTSLANDYSIREVPLADAVRSVCKKHARYLIGYGCMPDIRVPEDTLVLADRQWLEFVIAQIIINAAKYEAKKIRFGVEERAGATGASTVLEIADDGCGIPAADMRHIFERGFTGKNGRASKSSTGMGLYLVSTMCRKMGLGLAAASEEGTGTRILISFPHDRQRSCFFSNLTKS